MRPPRTARLPSMFVTRCLSFAAQPKTQSIRPHFGRSDAATAQRASLTSTLDARAANALETPSPRTDSIFGQRASHKERRRRQPQHKTMAEEKKSRACHYLQPQEWWFADKTPIESVFLMMS